MPYARGVCTIVVWALWWALNSAPASGAEIGAETLSLPDAWAEAAYATPAEDRLATFTKLAERARKTTDENSADALIWKGICLGSLAGERRSIGSLKVAREARGALLASIKLDDRAMEGAAHVSLGAMYYRLPPWPVSFGSKKKARRALKRALEISPTSMDANYFMADFLFTVGETSTARSHVETGLSAPIRPGRELADRGRQEELMRLLEKIDAAQASKTKAGNALPSR